MNLVLFYLFGFILSFVGVYSYIFMETLDNNFERKKLYAKEFHISVFVKSLSLSLMPVFNIILGLLFLIILAGILPHSISKFLQLRDEIKKEYDDYEIKFGKDSLNKYLIHQRKNPEPSFDAWF
jgi:hypothetical protein